MHFHYLKTHLLFQTFLTRWPNVHPRDSLNFYVSHPPTLKGDFTDLPVR